MLLMGVCFCVFGTVKRLRPSQLSAKSLEELGISFMYFYCFFYKLNDNISRLILG
jgi:hypothetical protein